MRTGALGAVLAGTLALSGCADMDADFSGVATAVLDPNETLSLETDPTGASCRLLRGGEDLGKLETPGRIELTPSRDDILVLCEKPGYRTAAAVLHAEARPHVRIRGGLAFRYAAATPLPLRADAAAQAHGRPLSPAASDGGARSPGAGPAAPQRAADGRRPGRSAAWAWRLAASSQRSGLRPATGVARR